MILNRMTQAKINLNNRNLLTLISYNTPLHKIIILKIIIIHVRTRVRYTILALLIYISLILEYTRKQELPYRKNNLKKDKNNERHYFLDSIQN